VRLFDDVLEVAGDGYVARTDWEHVTDVKESEAGVAIQIRNGPRVDIPKAMLPEDRRLLIDALPPHVRFEVVPPAAPAKHGSAKTIALWAVLVTVLYAIYQVLRES